MSYETYVKVACQKEDRVAKHEHISEMIDFLENSSIASQITKNIQQQIIEKSQKYCFFVDYKEQTWKCGQ